VKIPDRTGLGPFCALREALAQSPPPLPRPEPNPGPP